MGKLGERQPGATAIIVVLALAAALRIYHLGHESLWIDEGLSIRDTEMDRIAGQSKPLYYVILWLWMHLGSSEAMVRAPSVIFGLASVYLIYLLGKELVSHRAGLVAALFTSVSPFHIGHSQEVRMYTLLLLLSLAAVYFYVRLTREWRTGYAAGYAASAALALYTQPMAALLIASINLVFLLDWRRTSKHWRQWALCQALVLLLWMPILSQVHGFGQFVRGWEVPGERLALRNVPHFWSAFVMGNWNRLIYPDKLILRYAHFGYSYVLTMLLLAAIILRRRREETRLLAVWLVAPLAMMLALSALLDKTWIPRYLIYTAPALYLLIAAVISSLPTTRAVAAVALLLLVPLFRLDRYYANTDHAEWRPAVAYLESNLSPGDFVGVYKPSNGPVFDYYYGGEAIWQPLGRTDEHGELVNWPPQEAHRVVQVLPVERRSWLIVSRVPREATDSIEREIRAQGRLLQHSRYFEIDLYLLDRGDL